jgi:glyoxylase-like metal-dependent hydrolase (beta-lactamase superfamily II)
METRLVVPGVHLLAFEIGQAYLWDRGDVLTVVDTGVAGSAGAILDVVAALGRGPGDVQEIVLTHFHPDHRGGAPELARRTGARVLAHVADAPVIRGEQPEIPPNLTEEERPLAAAIFPRVPPAQPVTVDQVLDEGDVIAGGAVVLSVPGHTPGSMALLLPDLAVLFTGDTIASYEGEPILGPFNIDRVEAMRSVQKQAGLEFDVACFGHGAPIVGGAAHRIRALAQRF